MPNSINTLSPSFRDYLLTRNIISDTIQNNGLEPLLQGIGYGAEVSHSPEAVQGSEDIQVDGVFYKDLNTVLNKYQGDDDDYRVASVDYLPGDTNSTIAGNPYNHEPYSSQAAELLEANGDARRDIVIKNNYLDVSKQLPVQIVTNTVPTFQLGSYLDDKGNLNLGGPSTQPLDIVGSILTGGGVGFDPNGGGAVADFDVRGSLAGRVLTATGAIQDTRLGQISVGYLAAAIGNNIAFNLQQETIGQINTNPLSLLTGGALFVPNYSITVAKGGVGVALDLLEKMLGFETPVSLLEKSSSIFNSDNPISNIERANEMILNSGKGQVLSLFAGMNANIAVNEAEPNNLRQGYAPGYDDPRVLKGANQGQEINYSLYAYQAPNSGYIIDLINGPDNNPISQSNVTTLDGTRWTDGVGSGFDNDYIDIVTFGEDGTINKDGFIWGDKKWNKASIEAFDGDDYQDFLFGDGSNQAEKKSILYKTKELFQANGGGGIRTLVSGRGILAKRSQIQRGVRDGGAGSGYMSKGSGVLSQKALEPGFELTEDTNPADIFCRTWGPTKKYDQVEDMVRHSGLLEDAPNRSFKTDLTASVLEDTGFVRIGPYTSDDPAKGDIKRFMFSIENLAWADDLTKLLPCEKGPGDPLSGRRGRIMWFPPYEISFNEMTSVSWDKNNFIGRGEPVYTYNNTERTGTLSWKIIIDHPNYANFFPKNMSDDAIASFYAGCLSIDSIKNNIMTDDEKAAAEVANNKGKEETVDDDKPSPVEFTVYFPNDSSAVPESYETGRDADGNPVTGATGQGQGEKVTTGDGTVGGKSYNYPDNTNFGLNGLNQTITIGDKSSVPGWIGTETGFVPELSEYLQNECKYCKITIEGFASTQGNNAASSNTNSANNQTLSQKRADNVKTWLSTSSGVLFGDSLGNKRFGKVTGGGSIDTGCDGDNNQDRLSCKVARKVVVKIEYDSKLKNDENPNVTKPDDGEQDATPPSIPVGRFFTECDYFEKLEQTDKFVYSSVKEKIKYFHPAFHSMTPEGFNSRLNFLHQCTRQGPTRNEDGNPNNLAFGRAPICILRIGDFYHTKIVIDSFSIDYDPLVWDLNPEGVGVQPMIANVSINFSFIGGSSLNGPINKLQNAVSYNFFANTEVYDPRADRIQIDSVPNDKNNSYGKIQDGTFPDSPNTEVESDKKPGANDGNTSPSIISQEAVAQDEANKLENTQEEPKPDEESVENDIEVIGSFGIRGYLIPTDPDDFFDIDFEISNKDGVKFNLTKVYNGQFIIVDGITNEITEVGSFKIKPNSSTSFIFDDGGGAQVIGQGQGGNYSATYDGANNPNMAKIIELAEGSQKSIRMKFETGAFSNMLFSKNLSS